MKKFALRNLFAALSGEEKSGSGFGTFYGVYLPGILSMFGVIIYLRFGWIVGSVGLFKSIAIVTLACLIVFVTVLSIASAATNRHVGNGGTYYMVSRALGIEVGGAIGVPLFIAQALTISFATVGFVESIHPFFAHIPANYLGIATLLALTALAYFSASIALKTQLLIFLVILASLASLFLGKEVVPSEPATLAFTDGMGISFWSGFAFFFPAATGVEAGVSMSGNLRNPSRSLPLGTIAVLVTGYLVYLAIPFFLWEHAPRALLVTDPLIVQHISRFQALIVAGIWAATLSSALGGLLAAPRTLQALAADRVLPGFLAKEWGAGREPRIATLCCVVIAALGIYYGSINQIAPVLTMFYLIAYAMLNLASGLEGLLGNPSWRPTFRISWVVSMGGVVLCLMAMFMIDPGATWIALLCVTSIYLFMRRRGLSKGWEDIRDGLLMFLSRFAIYRLAHREISSRAWRPNFLVLSDNPLQVTRLIKLTSALTKSKGFLTLASVFSPQVADQTRAERWKQIVSEYLRKKKIEALIEFCFDESLAVGAQKFVLSYGLGVITPNTIVLGETSKPELFKEFFAIIRMAHASKKNVLIIRDKQATRSGAKKIHIWWDDQSRKNSELMLLFGHMLSFHKSYRRSAVQLNSVVTQEQGQAQRLKYFHDFFMQNRFSIQPKVFVRGAAQPLSALISAVSHDADLVLVGLRPPHLHETMESYADYYHQMTAETGDVRNVAFVISAEALNLREIQQ